MGGRKWELVGNNYGARVGDRYVYVKYTYFKCPVSVFQVPVKFQCLSINVYFLSSTLQVSFECLSSIFQ